MNYNTKRNLLAILAVCFVGLFVFGCVAPQQGQQNQTPNVTTNVSISNVTVVNQTTNLTIFQNVSANISKLRVSDFIVIDDSMPNLLVSSGTSQRPR